MVEVMKMCMFLLWVVFLNVSCLKTQLPLALKNDLRAPTYPLIVLHPDFNIWTVDDLLNNQCVRFSNGNDFPFIGIIRVDKKVYRFMGDKSVPLETIAPISFEGEWKGKYTFVQPAAGWEDATFDDSRWKTGAAAFGTKDQRNVNTIWPSHSIWVRREIVFDKELLREDSLFLRYSHDDVFQLYINGKQLINTGYEWNNDVKIAIPDSIIETMKDGKAVIAAHCENRAWGSLVDFGIYAKAKKQLYLENLAIQRDVDIQATQTHYEFTCSDVVLKLSFTAPLIMNDLEVMSRPINYISYEVASLDNREHEMEIYFELAPEKAFGGDEIQFEEESDFVFLKAGYSDQKVWVNSSEAAPSWGYFYMATDKKNATYAIGDAMSMRREFMEKGYLTLKNTSGRGCSATISQKLGKAKQASGKIMVGFDGIYTIQYFGDNLRPYWNKKGNTTIEKKLVVAYKEYEEIILKSNQFDNQLMHNTLCAGGKEYAELCALIYRKAIIPLQLSEIANGDLVFFTKDVGPVDVYFSLAPIFLCYNPELVEALLNPFFYYSESGKWVEPYPAHNLGDYPLLNGQTYEEDMPTDDARSLLILTAALAKIKGNPAYAERHWTVLSRWADYLLIHGVDTEGQLYYDDFAKHCTYDANLFIKVVLGIASYGYLAEITGRKELARTYTDKAREMAVEWEKKLAAGNHYRLAAKDDTWNQKYNIVWDEILELNIFSDSIAEGEVDSYLTQLNEYGLPQNFRQEYINAIWLATLATDSLDFRKMMIPLYRSMNKKTDRFQMSEYAKENSCVNVKEGGVVGGCYLKLLENILKKDEMGKF